MAGRLDGKTVIVTGAASGQGEAITHLFTSEGARVAALDINAAGVRALADDLGDAVLAVECDVSQADSVRGAVQRAVQHFGAVNVLYNNAGVSIRSPGDWDDTQDGPTADISEALFDRVVAVNLKSQFLMSKYTIPHLLEAGGGAIVNVASLAGVFTGSANNAYCASKGGVLGLSLALAFTYGPQGIRTNVICPGLVATPLVDHLVANAQFMAPFVRSVPLRRVGQAGEIAATGLFLASDDASYVNGAVIPVDGGTLVR